MRLSRIRLPPWMCDGEAHIGPRVSNTRLREPSVSDLLHTVPRDVSPIAAATESPPPAPDDFVAERPQCVNVGRHCMIVEVAANDVAQPFTHNCDRLVHAPSEFLLDRLELRLHAVAPGFPFDQEFAPA